MIAGTNLSKQNRITYSDHSEITDNTPLESAGKIFVVDLIGEGMIDGIVDKYGNDVSPRKNYANNAKNFKGIYYNDLAILDTDSDLFNYNLVDVSMKFGRGRQETFKDSGSEANSIFSANSNFSFSNPSVVYDYSKKIYPLADEQGIEKEFPVKTQHVSYIYTNAGSNETLKNLESDQARAGAKIRKYFSQRNFAECFGVAHEVRDKYTRFLIVTFQLDSLRYNARGSGDAKAYWQHVGVSIGYKGEPENAYIIHAVRGTATSPYKFDLYLDISDYDVERTPVVRVYNLSQRNDPINETNLSRSIQISSVTEVHGHKLIHPYSAYALHEIDARSQSQVPNRSYDLRLLKVKVPYNYDSESKEYWGSWNGDFDPALKWTDNPAWILYDLITNQRYGVGKFTGDHTFLNKWSAYEIAKFCDGLVKTNKKSKFKPVPICDIGGVRQNRNTICFDWDAIKTTNSGVSFWDLFGIADTFAGTFRKIALMNMKFYDPVLKDYYYKSFEGYLIGTGQSVGEQSLYLVKKMGASKIASSFSGGNDALIDSTTDYEYESQEFIDKVYKKIVGSDVINTEGFYASFEKFVKGISNTSNLTFLDDEDTTFFTEEEMDNYVANSGVAAVVFDDQGYKDLLEPRFTANIYLTEDTQVFDLINNIASIFRGVAYWNNFVVNFSSDRKDYPVFGFSNSNVKDGVFNYSGSSKDNRYTVVKIVYSDKDDNFRDKTVYVEDYKAIRDYGYIEREIIGFGITSETQARRIGKWFLLTNQIEKDVVSFSTGQEASLINVGNVITVSDQFQLESPRAGRIKSINDSTYTLTLDNRYDFIKSNDSIMVQVALSDLTDLKVLEADKDKGGYLYTFVVDSVEVIATDDDFRTQISLVTSTLEDKKVFAKINKNNLWFFKQKSGSTVDYKKEYRIVSIREQQDGEYEVVATEYNFSKFDYMEFDQPLEIPELVNESISGQAQKSDFIPTDLLSAVNGKTFDNEGNDLVSLLFENLVPGGEAGLRGSFSNDHDYAFKAELLEDNDYSSTFLMATLTPANFYNSALSSGVITSDQDKETIGLLVSLSLGGKRVSFRWMKDDEQTEYKIVYPEEDYNNFAIDISVYKIGSDYQLLP